MDASLAANPAVVDYPALPRRLALGALFAAIVTISLGGMTTSTDSGMAFVDWPLANGSIWPGNMTLAGWFEHLHRVAGALTGLCILSLFVWSVTQRDRLAADGRPGLKAHGLLLAAVVCQGLLGGFGVLLELPLATSVSHAVLAQITLGLAAFLVFAHSPAWHRRQAAAAEVVRAARKYAVLAIAAIVVQTLLGAFARHLPAGPNLHAVWTHVGWSLVVMVAVAIVSAVAGGRLKAVPGVRRAANRVFLVLMVQMSLGFVALLVRMDKHPENIQFLWRCSLRTSHVVVGALLLMSVAFLACRLFRCARPDAGVAAT